MQNAHGNVTGLTLIELLITLTVVATLACIALPSFQNVSQSLGSRSARSALSIALSQARSHAVTSSGEVVACPSSDQDACDNSTFWHQGWLVFADRNRNHRREADETIIAVAQRQANGVAIVSSNGRRYMRYQPDGTAGGSNMTFTVCDRRGTTSASTLVINNAGRVRSGSSSAASAAEACAAVGS